MMKVKKDWWRDFFNEVYLLTDARSVSNPDITRMETDLLEGYLKIHKNDKMLDLCGGQGRHSLELAKRGYKDLTVLDYSDYLIALGKKKAKYTGLRIKFLRRDARSTGLTTASFAAIFIMANSFGYFPTESENLQVLKEARRLLKKEGKLLLDLTNPGYAKKNLLPLSWHEANEDIIVCRKRELKRNVVLAREIVVSKTKGLIRDGLYRECIYPKNKILHLLKKAGFSKVSIKNNVTLHTQRQDYGLMNSRMMVKAVK